MAGLEKSNQSVNVSTKKNTLQQHQVFIALFVGSNQQTNRRESEQRETILHQAICNKKRASDAADHAQEFKVFHFAILINQPMNLL